MTSSDQACYTLINLPVDSEPPTEHKLKEDLQNGDIKTKTEALKRVIKMIINGEKFNSLLMTVIRFVMPSQDHTIKKLLLLFWEVVPKYSSDGKLLHEMILVCDAYRKDLQHPNEFIRGSTLRFLCKLKEPELLEPLMPAIQQCLEHRHAYVRRNSVLAIFTIFKNFDFLIPDAPEKIAKFLEQEQDASCKRNAFMMLLHADQERALNYLSTCLDQVHTFGDILQLVIVELIYKVCHTNPSERSRFIRCVYNLLQSSSPAVRYEAAGTLITLSSAPTAIKAVASCYIDLILKESDNNVKLIVLDRLIGLRENHERILQDLVMDVLRILGASDLEVRKKTLDLSMELVTSRTVEELVNILRKELVKVCASGSGSPNNPDEKTYRFHLVHTIYQACIRYPNMIATVVPSLCEILTYEDSSGSQGAGEEVCRFLREAIQRFDHLKPMILEKIMEYYPSIQGKEILRHTLWILGEFCTSLEEINAFMSLLRQVLGPIPMVEEEIRRVSGDSVEESALMAADGGVSSQASRRVTADGTYATQTAMTSGTGGTSKKDDSKVKRPNLQAALFSSEFLPAVVLSACLVKLFCRYSARLIEAGTGPAVARKENSFAAECMLIIASMIHLGKTEMVAHVVNPDHFDRMWFCLKTLADRNPEVLAIFDTLCRDRLVDMVNSQEKERKEHAKHSPAALAAAGASKRVQADDPVRFLQLASQTDLGELEDRFDLTMSQALGSGGRGDKGDIFASSKLNKVTQLTGFSDPIYSEAYVHVNQYDIVLDVLIVNQTSDTLQNLTLELATLGDLKLVEKPTPLTMAAHDFANIKANIKVSSSENGIIFGNIVYDVGGSSGECNCVVLNDIHIDIMEYIMPASCSPSEYRQMWNEFEWENKVTVNTKIIDLRRYLEHIIANTNMRCLTPSEALQGECDYLCVTLYARSIFGEHVLANLCLEKPAGEEEPVAGHIRIRAKTQGMAVTMGEKMSATQKQMPTSVSTKTSAGGA